jgi:hypothetical protein
MLWMEGGPSQLDTFDPHPGTQIGGDTKSISTSARGIEVAVGLDQVAGQMQHIALVRNVVSREGDHERAAYNFRTGYRPDPTLVHPSIGAIICHKLPIGQAEIPRHVSILPRAWYGRGGYLGGEYDAFKSYDPSGQLPDVKARVDEVRFSQRLAYLNVTDETFANDRLVNIEQQRTLHRTTIDRAVMMMSSEQLKAFDVSEEPAAVQEEFGDTPFGRGCLAALRLVEHGVRCIEVGLGGWDGHFNNYEALIITPPNAVSATDCRASLTVASLSMSAFGGVMIKAQLRYPEQSQTDVGSSFRRTDAELAPARSAGPDSCSLWWRVWPNAPHQSGRRT